MNAAARQFLRLVAHWPQLGGDDELAEQRAVDWLAVIDRYDPDVAAQATDTLIANWTGFHPSIGDWRAVARSVATHAQPAVPELESGTVDRERLDALLAEATAALSMKRAAAYTAARRVESGDVRLGPVDPHGHMPTYDDLYSTQEDPDEH